VGYDGVFLAIPGTGAHLELTAGARHGAPAPHAEFASRALLDDESSVRAVAERLPGEPVVPANPYWAEHGRDLRGPRRLPRRARAGALGGRRSVTDRGPADHPGCRRPSRSARARRPEGRAARAVRARGTTRRGRSTGTSTRAVCSSRTTATASSANLRSWTPRTPARARSRTWPSRRRCRAAASAAPWSPPRSRSPARTAVRRSSWPPRPRDIGNLRFYQRLGFRCARSTRDAFHARDRLPARSRGGWDPCARSCLARPGLPRADPEPEEPT
jgi:hypothetical protein